MFDHGEKLYKNFASANGFFAQHSAVGYKMFKKHVKIVPKNCGWLKLYDTVLERERKKEGGKVQIISRVETSF